MTMLLRSISILGLLAALAVSGPAASVSLDRAGTWTPTALAPPIAPAPLGGGLINDGSFEQGPPPGSAWTEVSDPACERIGDFSSTWYVTAFHGTNDFWAGGYCDGGAGNAPVTSSVTQEIPVPPAAVSFLSFYYIAFRPDPDDAPDDGDRAYVAVNGVEVWTLPLVRASDTYPNWSDLVEIDISAYRDQTIELTIGGVSVGEVTGNARLDYFEIIADLGPVEPATWGVIKALYR